MGKKHYPPRIPRTAHGFRAQELRNVPRGAWWVKGWLQAIEAMKLGARAGRGRVYAETGQVVSLRVDGSHVEATALGSRSDPYTVRIDFAPLPSAARGGAKSFANRLGTMPFARIFAGEMPTVVEEMFSVEGLSPYPTLGRDRFWCSCPDWSKPCKHIAAVLYLLGDVLIRDPALLLRLRGVRLAKEDEGVSGALPLWKGTAKLSDTLAKIYRRTAVKSFIPAAMT